MAHQTLTWLRPLVQSGGAPTPEQSLELLGLLYHRPAGFTPMLADLSRQALARSLQPLAPVLRAVIAAPRAVAAPIARCNPLPWEGAML